MLRSLTSGIPLRAALPSLVALLVTASLVALLLFFRLYVEDAAFANAERYSRQIHARIAEYLETGAGGDGTDIRVLRTYLASLETGEGGAAWIADENGTPLAGRLPPGGGTLFVTGGSGGAPAVERRRVDGDEVVLMATPITLAGDKSRVIMTAMPLAGFDTGLRSGIVDTSLAAAAVVVIAVLLAWLLAVYVAKPLDELAGHMRRIGRGKLDEPVFFSQFPEFMRLSLAMNTMMEGLRERLRMRESLAMAKEVQQRLLPAEAPRYPGLDIAARSYYCDETGGDYYDYLRLGGLDPDTAVIAIGDVSGHGIAAAMFMASARGTLRSRCHDAHSLSELMTHVNVLVTEDSTGGRFMTMLLVAVNAAAAELRWASAGHREPVLLDADTGKCVRLDGAGIPLGVTADTDYEEHTFSGLRPGQVMLLATDGLWEAANSDGEHFGLERLRQVIYAHAAESANDICAAISMNLLTFLGTESQSDDISFVVVKVGR